MRFVAPAGLTEFEKRWHPQSGDIVSFKHHGFLLTSKKPKLPTLYRMRSDLDWDTLKLNWKEQKPSFTGTPLSISNLSISLAHSHMLLLAWPLKRPMASFKSRGYWRKAENRRKYLYDFARSQGFDPLSAESWTSVTTAQIIANKVLLGQLIPSP